MNSIPPSLSIPELVFCLPAFDLTWQRGMFPGKLFGEQRPREVILNWMQGRTPDRVICWVLLTPSTGDPISMQEQKQLRKLVESCSLRELLALFWAVQRLLEERGFKERDDIATQQLYLLSSAELRRRMQKPWRRLLQLKPTTLHFLEYVGGVTFSFNVLIALD